MANRFFDDVVSKSIEFNLGFVNKVFINNNDKDRQDEEQTSSQIIEIKSLNGTLPIVQKKIKARPLFRGISDSITRGDLVLFSLIAKKFYYIGPLNTFNEPNYSNSNFYSLQLEDENSNLKDNIDPSSGYGSEYHSNILITKLQKGKNK